ncbi:hypothetical protein O9H85_28825 [Paenibacillus filicis]|uniref:Uncharacterized protein n=1 Tax=Paenibacillus gyeongsangnamensis TaxID=3388067 RepID=A0ABT4QHY9_9BACL|nr:hypothetical protein [Paenibacillus filicis]MCZ8516325.1 hypothetical protein [Paenibacillus filicis]
MSKVVVNVTTGLYYDIDLPKILENISYINCQKTKFGHIIDFKDFVFIIGEKGETKLGIEYNNTIELSNKMKIAFEKIKPFIQHIESTYSDNPLDKLTFSWSNEAIPSKDIEYFSQNNYKDEINENEYGGFYSRVYRVSTI